MARLATALLDRRRHRSGGERPGARPVMMAASIAAGPTTWRPNRRIDQLGLIDSPRFREWKPRGSSPAAAKGKAGATRCRARQSRAGEPVTGRAAMGEQARGCPVAGRASPQTERAGGPGSGPVPLPQALLPSVPRGGVGLAVDTAERLVHAARLAHGPEQSFTRPCRRWPRTTRRRTRPQKAGSP